MTVYSSRRRDSSGGFRRAFYVGLGVVTLGLSVNGPRAQNATGPGKTDSANMKPFVFLFRQSSPLSEADQKRRSEEVRAWARQQNAEGHKLDPRTLGEEKCRIGPNGKSDSTSQNDEAPLTALLFLEARDFAEAEKIAESHPALHHGVISVEVRSWTAPPGARPQP
jgi:uncharacterized protein YciI